MSDANGLSYEDFKNLKPKENTAGLSYEEFEKLGAPTPEKAEAPHSSTGGAFAHEAARSILPGLGGIASGAAAGFGVGLLAGPAAPIVAPIAAIGGGILGGLGVRKAQDAIADKVAPDSFMGTKQAEQEAEEHPWATFGGGLVGMGRPSASALSGGVKAFGTAAGRQGIKTVLGAAAKKGGLAELQEAAVVGGAKGEAAKQALEHFGHGLGSAAGVGAMTGMGIAEGEDPLTATAKGVAGLAIKPYVGPGGVYDPFKPKGGAKGRKTSERETESTGSAEGTETENTTLSQDEQDSLNKAMGKVPADDPAVKASTDKAVASATEAGMTETVAALEEAANTPVTPKTNAKDETAPQQPGLPADQATEDVAAGSTDSQTPADTSRQPEVVAPEEQLELSIPGLPEAAEAQTVAGTSIEPALQNNPNQLELGLETPAQEQPIQPNETQIPQEPAPESIATESTADSEPVPPEPNVAEADVLPGVPDEEQVEESSTRHHRENRPHFRAKLPELEALSFQAAQAGDLATLESILNEAELRSTKGKKKDRAVFLANTVRDQIAKLKPAQESAPAGQEVPPLEVTAPSQEEPAQPPVSDAGEPPVALQTEEPVEQPVAENEPAPNVTVKLDRKKASDIATSLIEGGIRSSGILERTAEEHGVPVTAVQAVKKYLLAEANAKIGTKGVKSIKDVNWDGIVEFMEKGWDDEKIGVGKEFKGVVPTKTADAERWYQENQAKQKAAQEPESPAAEQPVEDTPDAGSQGTKSASDEFTDEFGDTYRWNEQKQDYEIIRSEGKEEPQAEPQQQALSEQTFDDLDAFGDAMLGLGGDSDVISTKSAAATPNPGEPKKVSPKELLGYAAKGVSLIKKGAKDFGVWSEKMIAQFGEGIRPSLKDIYERASEYAEAQNPIDSVRKDLADLERWTNDLSEIESRLNKGERIVVPRTVDMDDPAQFSPEITFETDPKTKELVVTGPKGPFDAFKESQGLFPRGQKGAFSNSQIADFINKYLKWENVRNAKGQLRKIDERAVSTHTKRAESPMPNDNLENALRWYKLNVERKTKADRIYEQTTRLTSDAIQAEGEQAFREAQESVPEGSREAFDAIWTKISNYLVTKLGGTIERPLTEKQEKARRAKLKAQTVEGELAAQELKEQKEAERNQGPVLPSEAERDAVSRPTEIDEELSETDEEPVDRTISKVRRYSANKDYNGYLPDELEAMRWFTLGKVMTKVAAELRGEPGTLIQKLQTKGLHSVINRDALLKARQEITKMRERQEEGGTTTQSANAKRGESNEELQDFLPDSGQAPEDSESVFKAKEDRELGDGEDDSVDGLSEQSRKAALSRLNAPGTPALDRAALIYNLLEYGALLPQEMARYAEMLKKVPAEIVRRARDLVHNLGFSVEDIIAGKHETQELGTKATRLRKIRTQGEAPFDAHDFVEKKAAEMYPGVEFFADPDMNEGLSSKEAVGSMEAWANTRTNEFGVTFDPDVLNGMIRGLSPERAEALLLKTMDEEITHISSMVNADGKFDKAAMARTQHLGENMSMAKKLKTARFYLGKGATEEQIKAFLSDPLVVGWEYTRMMYQMMRTGRTTEVLRDMEQNPSLRQTLMGYLKNVARWIKARLAQATDPILQRQLRFIDESYSLLSSGEMGSESVPFEGGELSTRAAAGEKISTSGINDELPENERISYREWSADEASNTANRLYDNATDKGALYQSLFSSMDDTDPVVKLHLANRFRNEFKDLVAQVNDKEAAGERLSIEDRTARNDAKDRKDMLDKYMVDTTSKVAQVTRHSALLRDNPEAMNVQAYIKSFLGKTPADLAKDKGFNLRGFYQGLREIKQKVAGVTMKAAEPFLSKAGITDPEQLAKLESILAHPDTTFADVEGSLGSLLPESNAAKTRALAEQVYRLYANASEEIGKSDLAKVISNALQNQQLRGTGDEFIKKLNKFLKIGKFDEDQINDTVLKTLGINGYDTAFIKQVRKDIDRLASLPEGELRNRASLDILQNVRKRFMAQVLKDWTNPENRKHVGDLLIAAWQAGVLSGPPTMGVNLLGSAVSVAVESTMDAVGYALKTRDVRYFADVFRGFMSALGGTKGGMSSAAMREFTSAIRGEGTKYRNSVLEEAPHLENIDPKQLEGALKAFATHAHRLRWVGRLMGALDAVNMTAADEAQQRMAIRHLLTEKRLPANEIKEQMRKVFDPDETEVKSLRDRARTEVDAALPDKSPEERNRWVERRTRELLNLEREKIMKGVTTQSRAAAEHYTYNDQATGLIGKFVVGLTGSVNKNLPAAKLIFPFMNTLANIMNQTLDYTPYGFARAANKTYSQRNFKRTDRFAPRKFQEGSPEQLAEQAKATLGTVALLAITYMAYRGYEDEQEGKDPYFTVTGAGPKDPADKQQLVETRGWQANSIKIGKMWYRYTDAPVLGIPLGAIGTLFDTLRYKKDEQTNYEVAQAMAISAITTVFDKNLLQGATNLFNTMQGSSTQAQTNALGRLTGGVIGGFTNPGLTRWARNTLAMDKEGMVNRQDQSGLQGWMYSLVPFSIGYNTPALNTLGEPIKQPWYSATTRRLNDFSNIPPHPIITPLVQAGLMLPNPSKSTEFRYIDPQTTEVKKSKTGKYPEIMRRFVELRGEAMKEMLTPETVQGLQEMAKQDKNLAQQYLDSKIGGRARDYAVKMIESELMDGKLHLG
jgi:hypothetical protein